MSTPLGSEPAFPTLQQTGHGFLGETKIPSYGLSPGMSTRTWLAGTIAAGMAARGSGSRSPGSIADDAIEAADALLTRLQPSASPTYTKATPEPPEAR